MSHLYERAAASEAGFAAGRARRSPTPEERTRFRPRKLWSVFRRAVRRGLAARARFETIELFDPKLTRGGG